MRLEEARKHARRLLGGEGADTIDDDSAFLDVARRGREDREGALGRARHVLRAQPPAGVGIAAQRAEPGAGGIDQDALVEGAPLQVEALRDVALERTQILQPQPARRVVDQRDARAVELERDHLAARADLFGDLNCLGAGRGAAVDHGLAGLGAEQERNQL